MSVIPNAWANIFVCTVPMSIKIWCTNCIMYEIKIIIII